MRFYRGSGGGGGTSSYEGVWDAGTTYSEGALVSGDTVNGSYDDPVLYVSLVDNNVGNDPAEDDGTNWSLRPTSVVEIVNVVGNTGAAETIPGFPYTMHTYTLDAAAVTFTMPAAVQGMSFVAQLTQDATGNRVPTFTGVRWGNGTMPIASTAAGKVDIYAFACIDGANWDGIQAVRGLS